MAFALKETIAEHFTGQSKQFRRANAHTVHLGNFSQAWDKIISLSFMFHESVQLMTPMLQIQQFS